MSTPQPTASGDLSARPLEHLLLYVHQNKLSGTLVLWPVDPSESGQDRLLFQEGRIRMAQLREPGAALNEVIQLFRRQSGVFAFYAEDVTTRAERVSIDTFALVAAGLRQYPSHGMAPLLRRFGTKHLRLRSGVQINRLNLNDEERGVVQLLRAAPATVSRLREISGRPETADRVIYLLALAKSLQPYQATPGKDQESPHAAQDRQRNLNAGDAAVMHALESLRARKMSQNPAAQEPHEIANQAEQNEHQRQATGPTKSQARTRAPSIPPPSRPLSPDLQNTWDELVSRHEKSKAQNFFEVLGVGEKATTDEIKSAYLQLIKKWHPDRLPTELSDLRPWADRYFHSINEAHETLSNPKKRAEYLESFDEGMSDEQQKVDRTLRAAMEFRKVEVLMKRKRWDEAAELLEEVFELDDSDADYHVAKATIMFRRLRGTAPKLELARIKAVLDKALELDDQHTDAWYLRGELYEREEDDRRALQAFNRVLSIKPSHLQASRKVRLANMRKRGDSGQSDLLGRFFGKKK